MSDSILRLETVSHSFGPRAVLRNVSLDVARGEFLAVVGPSGCGKTTLLDLLSGFITPTAGVVSRSAGVRMVYQQDGLLPWLTVEQNIALGLGHVRNDAERGRQLADMLALIRLEAFREHYPHQLSGGMRQRVELARSLAGDAAILLLDEPFSSLDFLARQQMQSELTLLLKRRPRTVVFVTHHLEEAAQLADRIVVLSPPPGRIRSQLRLDQPRPRDPTSLVVRNVVRRLLNEFNLMESVPERSTPAAVGAACG
jgi:NitT/TauT family transport system ATP-binding protein